LRRFVARHRETTADDRFARGASVATRAGQRRPRDARLISQKVRTLRHQVAPALFRGFDEDRYPGDIDVRRPSSNGA
jgi:hypothetical protein